MNYFDELVRLLGNSYAPYSHFNVASIVVDRDGKPYSGVNVESVAYPTTMCAERSAIFHAISSGVKSGDITEVHILARDAQGSLSPATPCGACRQVIAEQSNLKARIYIYSSKDAAKQTSIEKLLPDAFVSLGT